MAKRPSALDQLLNPGKAAHKVWKDDRVKRVKKSDEDAKKGIPSVDRMVLRYDDKKFNEQKPSSSKNVTKDWERSNLKELDKSYGRSMDKKFSKWALQQGVPKAQHFQFRKWMDANESNIKSDGYNAVEGRTKALKSEALTRAANEKRRAEEAKAAKVEKAVKGEKKEKKAKNGLFEFLSKIDQGFNKKAEGSKLDRAINRSFNSMSGNANQEVMKSLIKEGPRQGREKEYDKMVQQYEDRFGGKTGVADIAADLSGYLLPGAAAYKGTKMLGLGAKGLTKGASVRNAGQLAKEGAVAGGLLGGAEVGLREGINPDDYNYKDNLKHLGLNVAAGAVLDPAISLAGPLAKQALRNSNEKLVSSAARKQLDEVLKSGDYTPYTKADNLKGPLKHVPVAENASVRPKSIVEEILSGRMDSPTKLQNPLGQAGELTPRMSQSQALKELTKAPTRATMQGSAPRPTVTRFDPDAPVQSKLEYLRNPQNPITEAEIPHVYRAIQELEERSMKLGDKFEPEYRAVDEKLRQGNPEYRERVEEIETRETAMKDAIERHEQWKEIKTLQDTYSPRNRPEYYSFKIPDNMQEDFADVPKRFRSARDTSLHIDEAATQAGYDSIDEFVNHLVTLDNALGTKRKDLGIPGSGYLTAQNKMVQDARKRTEAIFDEVSGANELKAQIEELSQYMSPREAEVSQSDPFEGLRSILLNKNRTDASVQQVNEPVRSDPYDGVMDDSLIDELIGKQSEAKKVPMPQGSPMGIAGRAVDEYAGTGMASMPKKAERTATKVAKLPEEVSKFRENWDSSIQSAKELEKFVTAKLNEGQISDVVAMLPEGSNKRNIAYMDNFAKQLQGLPKATARAVRSYQKGYKPVFDILKKNKIQRASFEDYALSKHALDIYENNADKAIKRSDIHNRLEEIESTRINASGKDRKMYEKLAKEESDLLSELDTLEMYKLPKTMTEERARHIVKQFGNVEGMEEAHKLFMTEQRKDLYALHKSGHHTMTEIETIMKAHPNYVSLKRNVPDSTNIFNYKAPKNASTPVRARGVGSEEYDILPVLDSAFTNRLETYNSIARNDAINTLERWSKIDGLDGIVKKISPNDPNFKNVAKNTLKGYKDGREVYYEVPPYILEMMNFQSSSIKSDVGMNFIKGINTAFKRGTTNWNPQFHIKSALRDTPQALANSRTDAKMWDMSMGFLDSFMGPQLSKLTGGKFKSYREVYKDMGADMVGFISQDMYSVHRMTESIQKGLLDGHTVLNPFKATVRGVENFGMAMEHGARLGEFRSAKKKGYSDADASFEATDLIDYSDQGRMTKALNPYDSYLSATIRGNIRTFHAMKNNPKKFMQTGVTFVTAPTLMMYGARYAPTTSDEQRAKIENMPTWQKNTFWAIPVPNTDKLILMPKPFILGQIFANPIERMLDHAFTDKSKPISQSVVDTIFDLKNVGMPPMTVAGLSTALEVYANKDFFTGMELEHGAMKGKPAAERYDSYTSEVAKKIGMVTGHEAIPEDAQLSPAKVDHVLKKAGGTLGRQGLDTLDNVIALGGSRPSKVDPIEKTLNPLGSLVYKDTSGSGLYGRIMKQAEKDTKQWRADNPDKLRMKVKDRPKTSAQRYYEDLKELNDEIGEIRESTHYSSRQKNELISELRTKQKLIGSKYLKDN